MTLFYAHSPVFPREQIADAVILPTANKQPFNVVSQDAVDITYLPEQHSYRSLLATGTYAQVYNHSIRNGTRGYTTK